MKRNFGVILLFSIIWTGIVAQNSPSAVYRFSLEDCLNYAFGNNISLQTMKLNEESQQIDYQQSKKERLPSVSASLGETVSAGKDFNGTFGGNANISASVPLYQGGKIANAVEQSRLRGELVQTQTSQYENTLTINILQAFLTVLGNEELLRYQQNVVTASEEQFRQGKAQYQYGQILESDYLLLEAQLANDRNSELNTRISRDNGLLSLKSLLSMPVTDSLSIISPDTTAILAMSILPSQEEALTRASLTLPDLKISQYNIDIANTGLKISKAGYLPTLSLHGSLGTGHSDFTDYGTQLSDRFNEQVGLSLSIRIFDNNRTKSKVTQSRIALQQAELDKRQTELDIQQAVITEYQDVKAAYNKYQTTNIRQNAYSKTFDVYRAQFRAGSITAVDLLQQQNNYISAMNDFIQSKYEFILKRKILDVYTGMQITM